MKLFSFFLILLVTSGECFGYRPRNWLHRALDFLVPSWLCNGQCGEGQGLCIEDRDCLPGFICKRSISDRFPIAPKYCTAGPDLQHKYNLTNGGKDCYEMCNGEHGPCDFCGGGLCCRKGQVGNGCDGHIGKKFHPTCVLPFRAWQCDQFPLWLQKTYHIEGLDFCEMEWNDEFLSSQPVCDDKILPTVVFYDKGDNQSSSQHLCTINMNDAYDGALPQLCPNLSRLLIEKSEEFWIVFIVHGFGGADAAHQWYLQAARGIRRRYEQKGRRMIIGEVYWREGALPNHGKDFSPATVEHIVEASKNAQIKHFTQIKNRAGLETIRQVLSCSRTAAYPGLTFSAISGYSRAASNTMIVGHALGKLAESIVSSSEEQNVKTFCVGHSLGSHVCGFTGKTKKLDGIIGLDPAGPNFEHHNKENRLDRNDAEFVEVLHTDAGELGIVQPIGHVDIYLNGGKTQPGCPGWIDELGCSHLFPLWFLPKIWERAADGDICRATIKCPDVTDDEIKSGNWSGCIFDEDNSVEVGRLESFDDGKLTREDTDGRGDVFVLNTADDDTNACYFTTKDIESNELHDADIELNNLGELEHEIEDYAKNMK